MVLGYVTVALALGGAFFAMVAAIGLIRLPDVYTRIHAASKSETLGAVLSVAAVALIIGTGTATLKAFFLLLFVFLTGPTAAHAIARAAQDQGIVPWTVDDPEGGEET